MSGIAQVGQMSSGSPIQERASRCARMGGNTGLTERERGHEVRLLRIAGLLEPIYYLFRRLWQGKSGHGSNPLMVTANAAKGIVRRAG
jgi:hypothetical protein